MVYDFDKKDTDRVLEFGCHVHEVCGTKVVYSELNPSSYNLDLYVYDLEDKTSVLLENNVADFFRVIKDKVYYTVGNDEHCPLFSINLDGTGRTEIMSNIENIIFVHAGWMYVVKRWRSNVLLMKVSIDGTKRVRITNKFSKIVKIDNGYVYYIDIYGDLHIVRNDGEEDRIIAEDISSDCIIDSNLIYFTRKEQVSDNATALSLYSMDVEGFNLRKIEFNINAMAKYDESTIYFEKNEVVRYEITTPVSVKETTTTYRTFNLTRVYAYDKMTHEKKVVLTLGLPKPGHFQFNSGCFGKKVTNADETYVEVPIRHKYVRRNKIKAGSNYQKQVTANNSLTQTAQGCSNNPGCSSNSGCLQKK